MLMEVVPGKSIGAFILGMPLVDAINYIQEQNKLISHVELKYSEEKPLSLDITLDLNEDGVMLRFEPRSQKLRSVEVYDVHRVTLSYSGAKFRILLSAFDQPPTLVNIYEHFGPTHPGDFDPKEGNYYLHYPGLSFSFPIPSKYHKLYTHAKEFPDRTTPVTSHIYLYYGSELSKGPEIPPSPPNSLYFETVDVMIQFTKRDCSINFISTPQDVLTSLGPPSRVFYKEEDKMKIHSSSYSGLGCEDYFYNYFHLGIDILFSAETHFAKKIILHTNFPSHYEFHQYVKCNFRIHLPEGDEDEEKAFLHPDMTWDEIQELMGEGGKPVVHNRGSNANPFGATLFYGYRDVIFEVMRNGHIASVCLFSS